MTDQAFLLDFRIANLQPAGYKFNPFYSAALALISSTVT